MEVTKVLDAKGLSCPMPVVKTKMAIDELNVGEVLEIHATDRGSANDMSAWADSSGHKLLKTDESDDILKFWIQKE